MIKVLVPDMPVAEELLPYLKRMDVTNWYTNHGPLVLNLESQLSSIYGGSAVTTVSSCTTGLELVLQSFMLLERSKVLIPALSFPATATAVKRAGHKVIYADVDPSSWMLTPDIVRECAKHEHFDAVIPVCALGAMQDPDPWLEIESELGVKVVIDAAAAFGNPLKPSTIPYVFSLHATKALGAGEGGFVVMDDRHRVTVIRRLSNFGIDPTAGNGISTAPGTNAKMSEYHAAVALAGLDGWEKRKSKRVLLHFQYLSAMSKFCPEIKLQERAMNGVYNTFAVAIPQGVQVAHVCSTLRRKGIETRRWYCPPLNQHPGLSIGSGMSLLPNTDELSRRLIGLPFHLLLNEAQIETICRTLDEAVEIAS